MPRLKCWAPGAGLIGPRTLPRALHSVRRAACARSYDVRSVTAISFQHSSPTVDTSFSVCSRVLMVPAFQLHREIVATTRSQQRPGLRLVYIVFTTTTRPGFVSSCNPHASRLDLRFVFHSSFYLQFFVSFSFRFSCSFNRFVFVFVSFRFRATEKKC